MRFWLTLMLGLIVAGCGDDGKSDYAADVAAARQAAQDVYIYGYPLLLMERTRQVSTAVSRAEGSRAPMNQFAHIRTFPTPEFKDVVSPNVDTLYSVAWLDLSAEPYVLSVPDARQYAPLQGDARYYLLQMLDGWTNVFDSPGLRTRGADARTFMLTGPGWHGEIPPGMEQIASPTSMVWITGRAQTNDAQDMTVVHAFQDAIQLVPLSRWGTPYPPPMNVPVDEGVDQTTPPAAQVDALDAQAFFTELAGLMQGNPPADYDAALLGKLGDLGIVIGQPFDLSALPPARAIAVRKGYEHGRARLRAMASQSGSTPINGWTVMTSGIGEYGDNYDNRALIALVGLGANLPEDAVYPRTATDGAGGGLSNEHRYTLTFDSGRWPPANAFWSLTMYDSNQALVANPVDRYAIGDRSDLAQNSDGSLTLYIQKDPPAGAMANNWLPAPQAGAQPFNLIMRVYWPKEEMLDGQWVIPPVKRLPD